MCTSIGFKYKEGIVFGRTLEIGTEMDNKILYVPGGIEDFIVAKGISFPSQYAVLGSAFSNIKSFGDGINEKGLMGSFNLFPKYASFVKHPVIGTISMKTSNAFNYLLTRCKDIEEVKERSEKITILKEGESKKDVSIESHFFFMDSKGDKLVLEPKDGKLMQYDNPYGVLTNSPEFHWHQTNLKNYINLKSENIEEGDFNGFIISKLGEGTGMLGIPGDFTPVSRFVRSAYFVSNTPKNLDRKSAILQSFRILSQFDIPKGSVINAKENLKDETLYTSVMDTKKGGYFIKCQENLNIQSFYIEDYKEEEDVKFIELKKTMNL